MERGFDGLYNHINPCVPDEALIKRLEDIAEYVNDVNITEEEAVELTREVKHLIREMDIRAEEKRKREEEIAWMEKALTEESNG